MQKTGAGLYTAASTCWDSKTDGELAQRAEMSREKRYAFTRVVLSDIDAAGRRDPYLICS